MRRVFGYNQIHAALQQSSQGLNLSSEQGLGGIPYTASLGGLPGFSVSGVSSFGTPAYYPADEDDATPFSGSII